MKATYNSNLSMPANYIAIDPVEASSVDGGGLLLTVLGIYGAYSVYENVRNFVNNNTQVVQQFQKSLASAFDSFLGVFEKFAVLKVSFDIFKTIF